MHLKKVAVLNKKTVAFFILKEAKKYKNSKIRKRQKIYLKPFKEQEKPWADVAVDYSVNFIEDLDDILTSYKNSCLDIIKNNTKLFKQDTQVKKSKNYKTNEYLDERYNHVIVDDIKDKLLELNSSFENALNKAYEKHITKGLVNDATGLVFKGMGMDFDFNKYDETTRDYLRDKKINWSKSVTDTTERGIKKQLVDGYENGLSSYDIALNINQSSNFKFSRCESIARTEIISSCNYADYIAFMENSNVIGLRWSSSGDKRVRATHKAADGQKRKKVKKDNHYELEQPFIVGSSKLKYPGDKSLGAEDKELVRCRCTLYPVFKDEDLDSNTIYDDKDVGTVEWVLRQDDIFQRDYVGGNAKLKLFSRRLLSPNDLKKPWGKIKKDINSKMIDNFEYLKSQGAFKGLHPYVINAIQNQLSNILDFGLDNDKENLCALGINKFKKGIKSDEDLKLFENIIANKENSKKENGENDENLVLHFTDEHNNKLDNEPENSVILIHNHPNGISFSPEDLVKFLKHKSIKYIFAVGHNGEIYLISNESTKKSYTKNELGTILEGMKDLNEKAEKRNLNNISSYHAIEILKDYCAEVICNFYNITYYTSKRKKR